MFYITLSVFAAVLLLVVFKIFPRVGVNTFAAIIFNYIVASVTGILFLETPFYFEEVVHASWFWLSVPLGALFISIFYLISLTAQRISIATASVANKMSVAMPVLFSVIFLKQDLSVFKIIGIALALLAVYLSSHSGKSNPGLKKLFWLPLLVFVGSGFIDIGINAGNSYFNLSPREGALFTISTFMSAFCFGTLFVVFRLITKKFTLKEIILPKNIFGGIILGVPNYFSIYFIFRALESDVLSSAQLFPVLNLSNVVFSAVLGWFLFNEQLSKINIAGICLAVISIILISV